MFLDSLTCAFLTGDQNGECVLKMGHFAIFEEYTKRIAEQIFTPFQNNR